MIKDRIWFGEVGHQEKLSVLKAMAREAKIGTKPYVSKIQSLDE